MGLPHRNTADHTVKQSIISSTTVYSPTELRRLTASITMVVTAAVLPVTKLARAVVEHTVASSVAPRLAHKPRYHYRSESFVGLRGLRPQQNAAYLFEAS